MVGSTNEAAPRDVHRDVIVAASARNLDRGTHHHSPISWIRPISSRAARNRPETRKRARDVPAQQGLEAHHLMALGIDQRLIIDTELI